MQSHKVYAHEKFYAAVHKILRLHNDHDFFYTRSKQNLRRCYQFPKNLQVDFFLYFTLRLRRLKFHTTMNVHLSNLSIPSLV